MVACPPGKDLTRWMDRDLWAHLWKDAHTEQIVLESVKEGGGEQSPARGRERAPVRFRRAFPRSSQEMILNPQQSTRRHGFCGAKQNFWERTKKKRKMLKGMAEEKEGVTRNRKFDGPF